MYTLNIIFARALSSRLITVVKGTGLRSISITLTRETTLFIADVIVVLQANGALRTRSYVYVLLTNTLTAHLQYTAHAGRSNCKQSNINLKVHG